MCVFVEGGGRVEMGKGGDHKGCGTVLLEALSTKFQTSISFNCRGDLGAWGLISCVLLLLVRMNRDVCVKHACQLIKALPWGFSRFHKAELIL